eukprot:1011588-Prymnesium_polylepis.1
MASDNPEPALGSGCWHAAQHFGRSAILLSMRTDSAALVHRTGSRDIDLDRQRPRSAPHDPCVANAIQCKTCGRLAVHVPDMGQAS